MPQIRILVYYREFQSSMVTVYYRVLLNITSVLLIISVNWLQQTITEYLHGYHNLDFYVLKSLYTPKWKIISYWKPRPVSELECSLLLINSALSTFQGQNHELPSFHRIISNHCTRRISFANIISTMKGTWKNREQTRTLRESFGRVHFLNPSSCQKELSLLPRIIEHSREKGYVFDITVEAIFRRHVFYFLMGNEKKKKCFENRAIKSSTLSTIPFWFRFFLRYNFFNLPSLPSFHFTPFVFFSHTYKKRYDCLAQTTVHQNNIGRLGTSLE